MSAMVIFSNTFRKQLGKLPLKLQIKVSEKIKILILDEFDSNLNNHKLSGEFVGARSINISGDIRLIYKKEGSEIYLLLKVGTHSQLY